MANLKELRDERLRKLSELKQLGINPFPAKSNRTHMMGDVVRDFAKLENKPATVAGRIIGIRKFGKLAFIVLKDTTGQLQLFLKDGTVAATEPKDSRVGLEHLNLLDVGDFIEAAGTIIKSKTGEISIEVKSLRILTKSLRPMPTAQDGFTNKEERMRRRYVDMNVNEDVRQRFIRRSQFWQATREFLLNNDFTEINIPVLEHTTGGADANPFVTHMDALDQDFYLRISHELPLKRLLGAGYEKVFDIGPRFRNENYSDEHLPEHVAMEWYWAYADWEDGMNMMESMFKKVLEATFGTLQFTLDGKTVDMDKAWERWDYATVIHDHYGLEVFDCTIDQVKAALKEHGLEVEKTENISRGIDKLWKKVRAEVAGPIWLINTPAFISPLSKADDGDPRFVQRFQAVIGGSELCNGWSELNDPVDQLNRFLEQQKMRDAGDDEAQMLDIDYVEMLEYGMPPACGLGFSERVFWIFEGVTAREGVPFPQLRIEVDEVTRGIYPEVFDVTKSNRQDRSQDFSKKITLLVNKELESWQMANTVAHMSAYFGNNLTKNEFGTADYFVTSDGKELPRNSQYPIIIKRATEKELHKVLAKARDENLRHHIFIKEMQDTTDDSEITGTLSAQSEEATKFYGLGVFGENEAVDKVTKNFQLWK